MISNTSKDIINFLIKPLILLSIRPKKGQWHSDWQESKLEPWKEVIRQLMMYHQNNNESFLRTISTEFIPFPDYGGGAKYSIFENSIACAEWLRKTWEDISNIE